MKEMEDDNEAESASKSESSSSRKMPEKELTKWKALINLALSYQKKKGNFPSGTGQSEGRWDVNVKALDGDFNSKMELGEEAVDVNITHATIQTLLSPLWTTLPYITVNPLCAKYQDGDETADNIVRSRLTEYELNYWMRELNINRVVKKCILDNAATNAGYAYIGFVSKKEDIKNDDGEATENEPQIRLKSPYVKRISPKYILFPPGYYEIEECPWIGIGWMKPCCDVEERYEVEELKSDMIGIADDDIHQMTGMTSAMSDYLKSDEAGYVILWQIWDKRSGKLISLTLGHEDALEVEDWPYDLEGFPIVKMRFTFTPDQQFGMPMMSAWLAQQKELNAARTVTRSRESRKKAGVFLLNAPEGFEQAYKSAPDGFVINIQSDSDDIRKLMAIDNGLPPADSAYSYGATQMQDLYAISGLGAQQRGSGDPNIESATASALVDKWAQIRQTDMGDTVRTFYLEIAKKIWMVLKQFPNTKRDMLVMGPQGSLQRITYTLAELKGEFGFSMELASLYSEDPATRQRNAFARYNLLRKDPLARGEKLLADVLEAGNKFNIESYLTSLVAPSEEFKRSLQGLPVQANELDDHLGHLADHDKHLDQLEKMVATSQAGSDDEERAKTAGQLMMAHANDHLRILAEFDTKKGSPAGKPIAENVLRADTATPNAGETQAELNGGPVNSATDYASPGGVSAV